MLPVLDDNMVGLPVVPIPGSDLISIEIVVGKLIGSRPSPIKVTNVKGVDLFGGATEPLPKSSQPEEQPDQGAAKAVETIEDEA